MHNNISTGISLAQACIILHQFAVMHNKCSIPTLSMYYILYTIRTVDLYRFRELHLYIFIYIYLYFYYLTKALIILASSLEVQF